MLIKNTGAKIRNFLIEYTHIHSFFYYLLNAIRLICHELLIEYDQNKVSTLFGFSFLKFTFSHCVLG